MTREAALTAFLRAQAGRRLVWGESDCLLTPADWLVRLGLPDPAAPWRGRYRDEAGAEAILAELGGLEALMRAALEPLATHGVRRLGAEEPRPGDVAAVRVTGPRGPAAVGAIRSERRWAVRAARGMWFGRADALAVWRVEV